MANRKLIKKTLEKLTADEFKKFKRELEDRENFDGQEPLSKSALENKDMYETIDVIQGAYSSPAVQIKIIAKILGEIEKNAIKDEFVAAAGAPSVPVAAASNGSAASVTAPPVPQVSHDAMGGEPAPVDTEPSHNAKGGEMPLDLILSTDAFKKEKLNHPDNYPVREKSSRNRLALLITNVEFELRQMRRKGAEKDEENMLMLLNELGYEVEKHRNLSGQEMDAAVKKFSQDPRLYGTDSVFVVIMSHGNLGVIKGVKWTKANDDVFQIEQLYTYLNTQNCPALLNKPKVIIIQACRGEFDGSALVDDGDIASDAYLDMEGIEDDGSFRAHKEKDFISLLSCTPHTVSYRHNVTGSFLIKYIFEIFHKSAHENHIEELFMKVMRSFEDCPFKRIRQMPTKDRCTLTKYFYLYPGY